MNKIQKEILKQMLNWGEYSYSSDWLEDIKIDGMIASKKLILANMRELRKIGLIEMYRGGLNDDGEVVGGTHFSIPYSKKKEVEKILEMNETQNLLSNPNHILCELTRDDFKLAKELFGADTKCELCIDNPKLEKHKHFGGIYIPWQYHLQQLIISPDPVAYIRENTKGDK